MKCNHQDIFFTGNECECGTCGEKFSLIPILNSSVGCEIEFLLPPKCKKHLNTTEFEDSKNYQDLRSFISFCFQHNELTFEECFTLWNLDTEI